MLQVTTLALMVTLGASRMDNVELRFKPTDQPGDVANKALRVFKTRKVTVTPFTDARDNKALIGRNVEKPDSPKDVTTKDDVGAFCAAQLTQLLKDAGVGTADKGGELVISGQVMRYMVTEGDVYQGTVALEVKVSAKGKQVWSGVVTGEAKRWGRSYSYDNYMESLSDALLRALEQLLDDQKLSAALEK